MTVTRTLSRALALAVALTAFASSNATAQADTARKEPAKARPKVTTKKVAAPKKADAAIRVRKEAPPVQETVQSPGEVVTPREAAPPAAPPPAPPPAAQPAPAEPPPPPPPAPTLPAGPRYLFGNSGFFIGAGGGTTMPYNQFSNLGYDPGFNVSVPIGWHRVGRVFGLRGMFAFDQADGGKGTTSGFAPNPKVYGATLDAVLKFPLLGTPADGRGLSVYTLAGGGGYVFRAIGENNPLAAVLDVDPQDGKKNVTKWGVNLGGGFEWAMGPTALFVESRWVNVFATGSRTGNEHLRWIPIVGGITIR